MNSDKKPNPATAPDNAPEFKALSEALARCARVVSLTSEWLRLSATADPAQTWKRCRELNIEMLREIDAALAVRHERDLQRLLDCHQIEAAMMDPYLAAAQRTDLTRTEALSVHRLLSNGVEHCIQSLRTEKQALERGLRSKRQHQRKSP